MNIETTGAVVIGAGVVGLACARELAQRGIETIILERHAEFGQETSSRNSEVIHAGLYYPTGSLKARLCVEGNRDLYAYCADHGVAHRRCGKLIVATQPGQLAYLEKLELQARANGAEADLLSATEALAMEPQLRCIAALHSPNTGIIDAHALMLALLGDAEAHGAVFSPNSMVNRIDRNANAIVLEIDCEGETMRLAADHVVNAAGLAAIALAHATTGYPPDRIPPAHFAKGNYYALSGRAPFSRLIYPVPEDGGLGVHLTLDLGGQARFGPDVEWIDTIDYNIDPRRADGFYAEVRKYWPDLPERALTPDYCGIRPKISGPGEPAADFMLHGRENHGIGGLVSLFGIESPGLTACLPLARHACRLLGL
jgi:L-2-hydroxyglutarate oxidase LhgO